MKRYGFPKAEKLCGPIRISNLFKAGQSFNVYPLRFTYVATVTNIDISNPEILVWASKRYFKRAVKRNLLKRQIREAYRLQSSALKQECLQANISLQLAINYTSKDILPYHIIERSMVKGLERLRSQISSK